MDVQGCSMRDGYQREVRIEDEGGGALCTKDGVNVKALLGYEGLEDVKLMGH